MGEGRMRKETRKGKRGMQGHCSERLTCWVVDGSAGVTWSRMHWSETTQNPYLTARWGWTVRQGRQELDIGHIGWQRQAGQMNLCQQRPWALLTNHCWFTNIIFSTNVVTMNSPSQATPDYDPSTCLMTCGWTFLPVDPVCSCSTLGPQPSFFILRTSSLSFLGIHVLVDFLPSLPPPSLQTKVPLTIVHAFFHSILLCNIIPRVTASNASPVVILLLTTWVSGLVPVAVPVNLSHHLFCIH